MPAPVSGSTLSKVMERKEMTNTALARKMKVTPATVAYWKGCSEIPPKRIAGLKKVLGPLTIEEGRDPNRWVRGFKRRYKALQKEHQFAAQDLADASELNVVTINNILNDVTNSPQERTMVYLDEGLELLKAAFEEGGVSFIEESVDDEALSFLEGTVKLVDPKSAEVNKIKAPGVYILYGGHNVTRVQGEKLPKFHGAPEYDGRTDSISRRMREHEEKWWYRGVVWIAYVEVDDAEQRKWLEAILIRLLNPQFNKPAGRPRTKK